MSTEIYYFSGTGNSLHVARELHKRLPDSKLVPMVKKLNEEMIATAGESAGFVFPLYFTTIPAPVRQFVKKLDMGSVRYTFSIVTRQGSFSVANLSLGRLLGEKGKKLDARYVLNMAGNTPTGLKPGKGNARWVHEINDSKLAQLEEGVQVHLDFIHKNILGQVKHPAKTYLNPFLTLLERVMYLLTRNIKEDIAYYTDSTCTGCGTCERVCLSQKIRMVNKRPAWQKEINCFYCYACFNFCPPQAILVKNKYNKKDGRYYHPGIIASDIARQKENLENLNCRFGVNGRKKTVTD